MTEIESRPRRAAPVRALRRPAVVAAVALAVLVLASSLSGPARGAAEATTPATSGWVHQAGSGYGSWTNQVVTVTFPSLSPTLRISDNADPRISTTLRLAGLAEVSPQGNFSAFAGFAPYDTLWQLSSHLTNGTLLLAFTTVAPVSPATGVWESGDDSGEDAGSLGNATIQVDVFLNETAIATVNAARVAVNATTWPWQNSTDALGLDMTLLAAQETRIAAQRGPTPYLLQELANTTNVSVASLSWSPAAAVAYSNGTHLTSPVVSYSATTALGDNSTVRVLFGSVEGGYASVSYDPWVALNLSAFPATFVPAWALSYVGWIALGVGLAAVAVLAVQAARRRTFPDDL